MALMKIADRKTEVYDHLMNHQYETVVLYGKPGVGKTWIAREVSRAAKQKESFSVVLWVYLNRKYDEVSLSDCIAQQLSLLPKEVISEIEEGDEEEMKEEVLKPEALFKKLTKKSILLVLDDEGNKMEEKKIRGMLNKLLKPDLQDKGTHYKYLVTTRTPPIQTDTSSEKKGKKYVQVYPMERDESLSLLKERAFMGHQVEGVDSLARDFLEKTKHMPNSIAILAKAFKYFFDKQKGGPMLLRRFLEEPSESETYNITDLLHSGYDLVPYSILIDCQRDEKDEQFFTDSHSINHNALIAYWIVEGYLGPISCMETAYRKGHEILMELIDFQVLKRGEADYVTINPLREELDDFLLQRANKYYRSGYYGNALLGLDSVLASSDWKGVVRLSHKGGIMRALPSGKVGGTVGALLLDGNSLRNDLREYITSLKKLQVLGVFNPTGDMLSHFKDHILEQLYVFVLRSCQFLKNINQVLKIEKFEKLTVLEVSGLYSLDEFPNKFFEKTPKLESLNLSSLPITKLPSSAYELRELKWLIVRDCTKLESLSDLRNLENLLVLDCSGSKSLKRIQDARFVNKNLLVINLSRTNLKNLPLISNLKKLTHLLLSECPSLSRLRSITNNKSLEIIDLSNSGDFNEFFDQSMEQLGNLKILDLSGTRVNIIPKNIGNPRHLCLENCKEISEYGVFECLEKAKDLELFVISNAPIQSLPLISHKIRQLLVTSCRDLKIVPDLSSLEKIEEIDFSGCKMIKSLSDKSFDKMSRLQKLNLSGTSIQSLPSLSNLFNLRRLVLKDCEKLESLPPVETKSLEKLEELNISGGKALRNIASNFFDGCINLHILDLSGAPFDELPSFSKLLKLHELYLRNCKGLKSVSGLEASTSLEILDFSGSAISDLPFLSKLTRLRKLMLRNCSSLLLFRGIGTLDLLGACVQNLPYKISNLSSLEHLDLPGTNDIQGDDCEWVISSLCADMAPNEKGPSISVNGPQFLKSLVRDPKLSKSTLKKFQLCVYPFKELDENGVEHIQGNDYVYKDVYIRSKNFGESDDQRLIEVYGFKGYKPEGIDEVFSRANQLSFVDNKFQERDNEGKVIETWQSLLATCKPEKNYGFWIGNCREIEVIFRETEIHKIAGLLNSIVTLWVSNTTSLTSIYEKIPKDIDSKGKTPEYQVFQNLKTIYLDHCPKLATVFSLSQLPKNLKNLHIKFCDNLSKFFEKISQETTLEYLETLHLWELPELESIGCRMPSLKILKVFNCPKLQNLGKVIGSATDLQNLSVSNDLHLQRIQICKGLQYLSIDSCPELVGIVALSQLPRDLEVRIRFCNKLEILFDVTEIQLEKLHLHGLSKLRIVGAKSPNQENRFIMDCLKLPINF